MAGLDVNDLVHQVEESKVSDFGNNLDSNMRVQTDYFKDSFDDKWVDLFEFTLPYLDKIVRNPKRFITTEEEIIKVEQAKKVGVETIKHLAKHTNFIQDLDEDTGDVIPSKLLNVFKEETFNTYENRFIYTLILRDNKKIDYTSTTMVGEEKVSVNITLNTDLNTSLNKDPNYEERIKKIETDIKSLKFSEVYLALDKEGVAFVTNPIKKTNVILKNVNFQYAMKLWDYIMEHMADKNEPEQEKKDYQDKSQLKELIDQTFLLEYLTVNSINNKASNEDIEKAKEKTLSSMLDKIIEMNPEMTKKQLQEKLGDKFDKVKEVRMASKKDIEKIFRKYMDKYFQKISEVSI